MAYRVTKRADGRYSGSWVYRDPNTGQPARYQTTARTATAVRQRLKAVQQRIEAGAPIRDASRTVGEWCQQWLETTLRASSRKQTTQATYRTLLASHVIGQPFGEIRLDRLKASDVDAFVVRLRDHGLSASTVNKVFIVARMALNDAVRDRLLAQNPFGLVKQPKVSKTEKRHLTDDETLQLLVTTDGTRFFRLLHVIAATGMRKGEALALKWTDVDIEGGALRVRGTLARIGGELVVTEPKTAKSRRTLPLDAAAIDHLKAQRTAQLEERLKAGCAWIDTGHVFTTESGLPMDPRNVLRAVTTAAKKAGLEDVNVHTLRHSAGSGYIRDGFTLIDVRDLLGHADIRTTADVYGHTSQDRLRQAIEARSAALNAL